MSDRKSKIELSSYKGKQFSIWLKAFAALVLLGMAVFAVLLGLSLGGAHDDIRGEPKVMVILGCQLQNQGPSVMLQDRLDKALEYLEDHPDITVVVSGGQGEREPTSEAQGMADYLTAHGFAQENIILEAYSQNTWQNLTYTAQHLEEAGFDIKEGVIIVSNGFHLTRARMLARRVGYENVSTLSAPSSNMPSRLKMYIREPIALVKSFVLDR